MKKIIQILVVLMITIVLITYTNMSIATSLNDLQNEQSDVKDQISSTQEELDQIVEEKSETLEQVEKLITQISAYNSEIEELEEKINELKKEIKEAEEQIKKDEEEHAELEKALSQRLVAMYKTGETSYLDFLLSSSSLTDFISSYYLISQVAEYDTKMLEQLQKHKEKIEANKEKLENSKSDLDNSKTTLTAKQKALEVAKKDKEKQAEKLSDSEKKAKQKLEELQETNDQLDREIKKAKAAIEAAKQAAANKKPTASSSNMTQSSSGFIWPVLSKYNVTTGWYYKTTGKLHGAVDFSGSGISGTPIYAVADGYVVTSTAAMRNGKYVSYGNYILIAHYNGLYTLYAHCSSRAVSAGQTVSQGQVIGYVGNTGNSTGPHLHFEVRTGNGSYSERVYPMNYLPKR